MDSGNKALKGLAYLTGAPGNIFSPIVTGDLSPYSFSDDETLNKLLKDIYSVRPQELDDIVVESAPSFKGFGRYALRGLTNKRTSPVGKTLSLLQAPVTYPLAHFTRMPSYHPLQDVVMAPWDNLGVTSHELGHAINFNNAYKPPGFTPSALAGNAASKLKRDAYALAYQFLPIYHEAKAWEEAKEALKDTYVKGDTALSKKEKRKLNLQFSRAKDPALATYAVGTIGRYDPRALAFGLPAAVGTAVTNPRKGSLLRELNRAVAEGEKKKEEDERKKEASNALESVDQMLNYEKNRWLRPDFEKGKMIGEAVIRRQNRRAILNANLIDPVLGEPIVPHIKALQHTPTDRIDVIGFSRKNREILDGILQGTGKIQNPAGLPMPSTVKRVRFTPISDRGLMGDYHHHTKQVRFQSKPRNPEYTKPEAIANVLAHEIGGHGLDGVLSYNVTLPGNLKTDNISRASHYGFSEFIAEHNGLRTLLEAKQLAEQQGNTALSKIYDDAILRSKKELLSYNPTFWQRLLQNAPETYVSDNMKNQLRAVKNLLKRGLPGDKKNAMQWLGVQSFYSGITPESPHAKSLATSIRNLSGEEVPASRWTQNGIPIIPEMIPVYDSFLRDLDSTASKSLKPNLLQRLLRRKKKEEDERKKEASTASLLRYATKLRARNLPVPREVVSPLAYKTQKSLKKLDKGLGEAMVDSGMMRQFNTLNKSEDNLFNLMLESRDSAARINWADTSARLKRQRYMHRFNVFSPSLKDRPTIPPPKKPNWWQRLCGVEVPDPKYDNMLSESIDGQKLLRGWGSSLKPLNKSDSTLVWPANR